jgi:hypothetical protein
MRLSEPAHAARRAGALKKGVSSGVLTQDKQSFLVSGDAPIEAPEEEKMEVFESVSPPSPAGRPERWI